MEYVPSSAVGCHISAIEPSSWLLRGGRSITRWRKELKLGKTRRLPELSLEPRSKVLSLVNETETPRAYFVSVCHPCEGSSGELEMGVSRDSDGHEYECVTLVVYVPPREVVDACKVRVSDARMVQLESDIVPIQPELVDAKAPVATLEADSVVVDFPLPRGQAYLCSQSACGALTHRWHLSTFHAIDFEAPVGTEVLAVAAGRVVDIKDNVTSGGCHVKGFFEYNALTIEHTVEAPLSPPVFVEYVHIRAGSASGRIAVGDLVHKGQPVAEVGDAGFCPSPHLHIEAHWENHPRAPSVPMVFKFGGGSHPRVFVAPSAGEWYEADSGMVMLSPALAPIDDCGGSEPMPPPDVRGPTPPTPHSAPPSAHDDRHQTHTAAVGIAAVYDY